MTAIATLRVVTRSYATVAATYGSYEVSAAQPDLYAHLQPPQGRCRWWLTSGDDPAGTRLAEGRALSRDRAVGKAIAAAHRPGIGKAVTR
jgi:hypothetical protein